MFGALAYDPMTGLAITPEMPDPSAPVVATPQGTFSKAINRLAGTQFGEPRMQTWPEKLVRSAATLPGDVVSGDQPMLQPGLRREDYTDAAPPARGSAEGIFGNTLFTPVPWQPNDPAYERAQDLAGMAGGGMMFGRLGAEATLGSGPVMRRNSMIENADQLRELANQRRARGEATGKSAPGWDFKRPDAPKGSWDDLVARTKAGWEADKARAIAGFEDVVPPKDHNPYLTADDHAFLSSGQFLSDSATPGAPLAAVEAGARVEGPVAAYHALLDQPQGPAYKSIHGPETAPATPEAAPRGDVPGGAGGGDGGLSEAAAAAARRAGARQPLEGLPTKAMKIGDEHFIPGPIEQVHKVAEQYMAGRDVPSYHKPPDKYHPLDEEHARAIAQAFEDMPHTPDDPATKASYQALIKETADQYRAIKDSGLKIEAIPPDMPDPYATNPRLAAKDVADNNHLWFSPTEGGFGSGAAAEATHPMLAKTGEKLGDRELLANDMFRIVHDYFGHLKEGHGFRAAGEDNAWRSHAAMYSDLARPAMTTETRGQNSVVNFSNRPLHSVVGEAKARELYGDAGRAAGAESGPLQRGGVSDGPSVPGLQSMARNDGSVLQSQDRSMGELRRPGDNGTSADANSARVSGHHGAPADRGAPDRPLSEQRGQLRAGKRALGDVPSKSLQPAPQHSADVGGANPNNVGVGGKSGGLQTGHMDPTEQIRLDRRAGADDAQGQPRWKTITVGEHNRTASAADTIYADQKVGLMPEWTMRDRGSPEPIIAYHGTPHSFDKFDPAHIGAGEGNQAYGHGLYFAGHEPVSDWYRHQLSSRRDPLLQKYGLDSEQGAHLGIQLASTKGDTAPVISVLQEGLARLQEDRAGGRTDKATQTMIRDREAKIAYLKDPERATGHMYQVAIDHPPEKFLDWDKPLKDQPQALEAVRKVVPEWLRMPFEKNVEHGVTGGNVYQNYAIPDPPTTGQIHPHARTAAALKAAGVPGIRYLDQGSRSSGKGTQNYVTFDSPRLLKRYAAPGLIGAGGFGSLVPGDQQ